MWTYLYTNACFHMCFYILYIHEIVLWGKSTKGEKGHLLFTAAKINEPCFAPLCADSVTRPAVSSEA